LNGYVIREGQRPKKIETTIPHSSISGSGEPLSGTLKTGTNHRTVQPDGFIRYRRGTSADYEGRIVATWKGSTGKAEAGAAEVDPTISFSLTKFLAEPRAWYWRGPEGQYECL